MKITKLGKLTQPAFKVKSNVKAGADPRGYCLQGCMTQETLCRASVRSGCDQVRNQCLVDCTGVPESVWLPALHPSVA
jgi:hypothetical protein